jgi:hypothetical protein
MGLYAGPTAYCQTFRLSLPAVRVSVRRRLLYSDRPLRGEPSWKGVEPKVAQTFSTCPNSSSTGVERPKMVTETRSRLF